jgi:hypothetical protein
MNLVGNITENPHQFWLSGQSAASLMHTQARSVAGIAFSDAPGIDN